MRNGFLLDPDVVYLNHGSYGACSEPVFREYQRLQLELERQPTDFFTRRAFTGFWGEDDGSGARDPRGLPGSRRTRPRVRAERDVGAERRDPLARARPR